MSSDESGGWVYHQDPLARLERDLQMVMRELNAQGRLSSSMTTKLLWLEQDIREVRNLLQDRTVRADAKFVTIDKFTPVQRLVYSILGIMGASILGIGINAIASGEGVFLP
jgi:hypothetical protein